MPKCHQERHENCCPVETPEGLNKVTPGSARGTASEIKALQLFSYQKALYSHGAQAINRYKNPHKEFGSYMLQPNLIILETLLPFDSA